ncbi:MAG TPA: hypothetical protein VK915_02760 [Gaiellaceae bacterium]|nr:hypothetical protein [Gaiellaceae bacterium]
MGQRFAGRTGNDPVRYRIVVRGDIGEPLVGPLEGMTAEAAGDETVLTGNLVDQAQLQGALSWLAGIGVEVVSVNPVNGIASR